MNILIIAKFYNHQTSARAIQMRRLYKALRENSSLKPELLTTGNNSEDYIHNINASQGASKIFHKVINRYFCSPLCFFTTPYISKTFESAKKIITEKKITHIHTVSSPFESHIVGLKLKEWNPDLKWSVFFSDPWPYSAMPAPYYKKKLLSAKDHQLVQTLLDKCDGFVTPSSYTEDLFEKKWQLPSVHTHIPHLYQTLEEHNYDSKLDGYIVHTGYLPKERISKELILAIRDLQKKNKSFKGLIHIGAFDSTLPKLIRKYNATNILLTGNLPEAIASSFQSRFSTGIIIEAPMKSYSPFMPSKIADSIAKHNKIITISPENSFLATLSDTHEGVFSGDYSVNSITNAIDTALLSDKVLQEKTKNLFSPESVSNQYILFFNQLK